MWQARPNFAFLWSRFASIVPWERSTTCVYLALWVQLDYLGALFWFILGFPSYRHLTFRTETFRHRHFFTGTFWPCRCSGTWTYHLHGRFGTRTFRHRDFLAHRFFGTMDVSARGHFGTWTFQHGSKGAKMSILFCMVPKYPCAAICLYWNRIGKSCVKSSRIWENANKSA